MPMRKVLKTGIHLNPGQELRLLPGLDVSRWDRIHLHVGSVARTIPGLRVQVLFGTFVKEVNGTLLADSVVWFEDTVAHREFVHQLPSFYNGTGFVMSIPVVAPLLYDVILTNAGQVPLQDLAVTLLAQEI